MSVELLAPCGSVEALDAAIGEGADAVYFGLKSFNARLRGSNFAWNQAAATIETLHKQGKKAYITVNTVIEENECEKMYRFLHFLSRIGPDALIVQDLGVLEMLHTHFPKMKVHASTQMNIASSKAANIASKRGISRVVLARELSLQEIQQIYQGTNCELEVFVHGALCISESGLCMFSSYLGGKSANRGMCTQACRRYYNAKGETSEHSGYFFSPCDLQLIDVVPDLAKAGVASFKIEGRMKSAEYVGGVVKAYRYVLDNYEKMDAEEVIRKGKEMLAKDFSRSKTHYHIFSPSLEEVLRPDQAGGTGIPLGKIVQAEHVKEEGAIIASYLTFSSKDILNIGDSIRIHEKNDAKRESCKITGIKQKDGKPSYLVKGMHKAGDFVYLIQEKNARRYPHILPNNLDGYNLMPRDEKLPEVQLQGESFAGEISSAQKTMPKGKTLLTGKTSSTSLFHVTGKTSKIKTPKVKNPFPSGLYVQVSSFDNIKALISVNDAGRPVKLIVNLNEETTLTFEKIEEGTFVSPFSKKDTIISLEPFLREEHVKNEQAKLEWLVESGYHSFILNNLAHVKMIKEVESKLHLKDDSLHLIAGAYLYAFNRYAIKFLEGMRMFCFTSPIENSYANLESCILTRRMKSNVLITVFAYPALFRMSSPLPESYDFLYFSDKEKIMFKAFSSKQASFVLPEKPFSITHRVGVLRKNGFDHFLIDLSFTAITVKDYRFILKAFLEEKYIEDTTVFNWKEGFFKESRVK